MMPPTTTRNPSTAKSVPLPTPWDVTTILADGSGGSASAARSASSMIVRCMGSEVRLTRLLDPAYMISRRRFAASAGVSSFASVMPISYAECALPAATLTGGLWQRPKGRSSDGLRADRTVNLDRTTQGNSRRSISCPSISAGGSASSYGGDRPLADGCGCGDHQGQRARRAGAGAPAAIRVALGVRRALDYALFLRTVAPGLAHLKSRQAWHLGRAHAAAARCTWEPLAEHLTRVAGLENEMEAALRASNLGGP